MADLTFRSAPRISAASFTRVLTRAASPVAGDAANLYAIIVSYGLDPAVALAMFAHESRYGNDGVAHRSLNWGNLRHGARAYKIESGFEFYRNWADSLRDWCELIRDRYVGQGLATIELAIPVYAPPKDHNVPAKYIAAVHQLVAAWQASDANDAGLGPVSRIVAVSVARVRALPNLEAAVVSTKSKGTAVGGLLVVGALVQGSVTWLKLRDGQFMHSSVLL